MKLINILAAATEQRQTVTDTLATLTSKIIAIQKELNQFPEISECTNVPEDETKLTPGVSSEVKK